MSRNAEQNILISFVLPIYNVEKYLRACVASIYSQDFGSINYEVICVEDCSTDGTRVLLESLQKEYDNLKIVYNKQNGGLAFSRNAGLREAKGKYVWFVDSDDLVYPGCVPGLVKLLEENDPDLLSASFIKVPEEFCLDVSFQPEPFSTSFHWGENLIKEAPTEAYTKKVMTTACVVLFKTELLRRENLTFDEDIVMSEDADFYMFFPKGFKILKSEAICYLYRQRGGSILHSPKRYQRGYLSNLYILEKYLRLHENDVLSGKQQKKERKAMLANLKYNIAQTLVLVDDRAYVKEQLKILRKKGYYPFPCNYATLKNRRASIAKRLALFLLPIQPIFLLVNSQQCKKQKHT